MAQLGGPVKNSPFWEQLRKVHFLGFEDDEALSVKNQAWADVGSRARDVGWVVQSMDLVQGRVVSSL